MGTFDIGPLPAVLKGKDKHNVKLKVKLNLNGLVECTEAQVWEEYEEEVQVPIVEEPKKKEEPKKTEGDASEKMETEGGEEGGEDGEQKEEGEEEAAKEVELEETKPKFKIEIKKKTKKTGVPIKSTTRAVYRTKCSKSASKKNLTWRCKTRSWKRRKRERTRSRRTCTPCAQSWKKADSCSTLKEDVRTSFKELLNNTEDWLYEATAKMRPKVFT